MSTTWEQDRDEGARLLVHYFRMMHERDGRGHWDHDYEVEIREAVDYIVEAAFKRASISPAPPLPEAPPSFPSEAIPGSEHGTEPEGAHTLRGQAPSGAGDIGQGRLPDHVVRVLREEIERAKSEGFEASAAEPPGNPWARAYARVMEMVLKMLEVRP